MTAFGDHLARLIAAEGPMPVATFMALANAHYYGTRDPIGARGDFITAPEISQMFGELIALWLVEAWHLDGAPDPVHLIELGPGRGTLMADMRRTLAKVAPDLARAARIHLIETSPTLRAAQRSCLGGDITWHTTLDDAPDGPLLLVANEFFDALPIRQFVHMPFGWAERCIALADDSRLVFAPGRPAAAQSLPGGLATTPVGSLLERCPAGEGLMKAIAGRIAACGGASLIIDYGHCRSAPGETLQALRSHRPIGVLEAPGETDLTAHVDFAALHRAAEAAGAQVHGPVTQGAFLKALGIDLRAGALRRGKPAAGADVDAALHRLTDPTQMGSLFKVLAVSRTARPPTGVAP